MVPVARGAQGASAHRVCISPPSQQPQPRWLPGTQLPPLARWRAGGAPGRWRGEKSAFKISIHSSFHPIPSAVAEGI